MVASKRPTLLLSPCVVASAMPFMCTHLYKQTPSQVDVCQLGSLGPKAIIGDIPALLGGVQPASIVAKTPLRVLQCRADKFAAHLDHNIRAKIGEPCAW